MASWKCPVQDRHFILSDCATTNHRASSILLGHAHWQRRFEGDTDIAITGDLTGSLSGWPQTANGPPNSQAISNPVTGDDLFRGSDVPDLDVPSATGTIPDSQSRAGRMSAREFPAVVTPLAMQQYMLLQRNLVYTGMTRGKKLVVMIGQRKALGMAVKNKGGIHLKQVTTRRSVDRHGRANRTQGAGIDYLRIYQEFVEWFDEQAVQTTPLTYRQIVEQKHNL